MTEESKETEVLAKASRRRFTREYKRAILREVAGLTERGAVGALLRREGLFSSHLASWRTSLDEVDLQALTPKKRGPKPRQVDERDRKIVELERQIARLTRQLARAEMVIDVQKKLSVLLGIPLPESDETP
jgi:transposase-like protein